MQKPSVSTMTLRQKIGQTGMPAPNVVAAGVKRCSGYKAYFEEADIYLNAYSSDPGTMRAFADGILGDFPFTGKSPVKLRPEFRDL